MIPILLSLLLLSIKTTTSLPLTMPSLEMNRPQPVSRVGWTESDLRNLKSSNMREQVQTPFTQRDHKRKYIKNYVENSKLENHHGPWVLSSSHRKMKNEEQEQKQKKNQKKNLLGSLIETIKNIFKIKDLNDLIKFENENNNLLTIRSVNNNNNNNKRKRRSLNLDDDGNDDKFKSVLRKNKIFTKPKIETSSKLPNIKPSEVKLKSKLVNFKNKFPSLFLSSFKNSNKKLRHNTQKDQKIKKLKKLQLAENKYPEKILNKINLLSKNDMLDEVLGQQIKKFSSYYYDRI